MKTFRTIYILILIGCLNGFGQSDTAIKLYDQKKYHEAWKEWNNLLLQGAKGEELYYNIANAYYKQQEYPKAILFYNKALKWNPNCSDCKKNLLLAQKAAGVESFDLPKFILLKWYDSLLLSMQPLSWFTIGIIFTILLILFLLFKQKFNLGNKYPFALYIMGIGALLCIFLAWRKDEIKHNLDEAILMKNSALHLSPDTSSETKQELTPGQLLIIIDHISGWYKVQTKEYDLGWVDENKLEVVCL